MFPLWTSQLVTSESFGLYTAMRDPLLCYSLPRVRELSTGKVGTLLRITGQVVRTHPVYPELIRGTFLCLECQTSIPDVEQQFKFTQPTVCKNPMCQNRRRFMLDISKSCFVDFQKVRIQETQKDVPRGIPRRYVQHMWHGGADCPRRALMCVCACSSLEILDLPLASSCTKQPANRALLLSNFLTLQASASCWWLFSLPVKSSYFLVFSLDVILRAESVEMVQAGDKCDFIGTLIVVPDVAQLRIEGL